MQSMTIESAKTITKELREVAERIEVTGIDATGTLMRKTEVVVDELPRRQDGGGA